ncbi:MAG: HPr(Ser) kinase/phosphatase [Candidatus Glassbacteria bacterium]
MKRFTVRDLLKEKGHIYHLGLLTEDEKGLERTIYNSELNRPGLIFAGFTHKFAYDRIQILGQTEIAYLRSLTTEVQKKAIEQFLSFDLPCIIITRGNEPPLYLIKRANERGIPVLRTSIKTARLSHFLSAYLNNQFAPHTTLHGTLVDVYGAGLLFQGKSGIGKSECALDLVERGHRLVADDLVYVTRSGNEVLIGRGSEHLRHHMEIRGIGIIDVFSVFGVRAVRLQKRIEVIVQLEEWRNDIAYERTGLEEKLVTILDVQLPEVTIPLVPGKNITVISEVIAMNHLLKLYGHHPARAFNEKLISMTGKVELADQYLDLEQDFE